MDKLQCVGVLTAVLGLTVFVQGPRCYMLTQSVVTTSTELHSFQLLEPDNVRQSPVIVAGDIPFFSRTEPRNASDSELLYITVLAAVAIETARRSRKSTRNYKRKMKIAFRIQFHKSLRTEKFK